MMFVIQGFNTKNKSIKLSLTLLLGALFVLLINTNQVNSQITLTTPNITPQQAVQDILLGAGVNAFNITVNGNAASANSQHGTVRHFVNTSPNFPLEEGVLMHTNGGNYISD